MFMLQSFGAVLQEPSKFGNRCSSQAVAQRVLHQVQEEKQERLWLLKLPDVSCSVPRAMHNPPTRFEMGFRATYDQKNHDQRANRKWKNSVGRFCDWRQDMLFSQWRAEVQEARAELHDQHLSRKG